MMKRKNVGGRPRRVFTEEQVTILERLFRADATNEEACQEANINLRTYYREIERNPGFCHKIRAAQRYPILLAKKNWIQGIMKGDVHASIQFLRLRQSHRYNTRIEASPRSESIPIQVFPFKRKHPFRRGPSKQSEEGVEYW